MIIDTFSSFIGSMGYRVSMFGMMPSETRWRGTVMHEYAAKIRRIMHIYFGTRGRSFVGAFRALN